jgi:hypothetical protein
MPMKSVVKQSRHQSKLPFFPIYIGLTLRAFLTNYEGVSRRFRTELITKSTTTTTTNTRWEAKQWVMAAKLTILTHKIATQLHLVLESCTICSSDSRRLVRKLLDTPSYFTRLSFNCELSVWVITTSYIVWNRRRVVILCNVSKHVKRC